MQPTGPMYRLDYHGDDVPEYLSEEFMKLVISSHHPPRQVAALLAELRRGQPVRLPPGVLRRCQRPQSILPREPPPHPTATKN